MNVVRACQPHSRKHPASSPPVSPVAIERRRRTLRELSSPHTSLSSTHVNNVPNTHIFYSTQYNMGSCSLKLEDFKLSVAERRSMTSLQEDIFRCMLLKHSSQGAQQPPGLLIVSTSRQTVVKSLE